MHLCRYGAPDEVPVKVLNQSVKRNPDRFPPDFMFRLTRNEYYSLRSQIVTLEKGRGRYSKYNPYAFTEQGVAMLSSVINSRRAAAVNVRIMRVFVRLREMIMSNKDILLKLEELEKKMMRQDEKMNQYSREIQIIFDCLKKLLNPPIPPRKQIGFKVKGT